MISYSQNGYVITFDGCGPDENELVKSLKQGIEKGEIKCSNEATMHALFLECITD